MMCRMTQDWAHLGRTYAAARKRRRVHQDEAAEAVGCSRATLQKVEQGRAYVRGLQSVHHDYARWLGWTGDSPARVLAGGEPVFRDQAGPDSGEVADLSVAVLHALREGALVDSRTVTVPTSGGDLTATIVVRGDPDRSPEELHEALLELRRRGLLGPQNHDETSGQGRERQ